MTGSKRLQPVQRLAESKEQDAARELGKSQRNVEQQKSRLEELRQYHTEYNERFQAAARAGISAAQLHEYRAFLVNLENAIKEQEKTVTASQQASFVQKEEWKRKHTRTQALGKVMQRYKNNEQQARDNREQKDADDRSQRSRNS